MMRSSRRLRAALAGLALGLIAVPAVAEQTAPADPLVVVLDRARLVRIPDHVATVVVGNPLIADVSVQAGGILVITGKGYGITNLIALDRGGKVLMSEAVQVQGPPDAVVVYRGVRRESYSCTPECDRRITLGDTPEFFNETITQTGIRNQRAQTGTAGGTPAR
ncbi:pilus assembly protein N-terminal domain-containing protein [Rhodoplanes azumiensis]|uniref:Pilus assembly protein N-terminal domain-containing protein n=1 Tax=Rhodoplanes azumiensis TaxID=1897628 RepID=A0ABW5APQ6_9BRAD